MKKKNRNLILKQRLHLLMMGVHLQEAISRPLLQMQINLVTKVTQARTKRPQLQAKRKPQRLPQATLPLATHLHRMKTRAIHQLKQPKNL